MKPQKKRRRNRCHRFCSSLNEAELCLGCRIHQQSPLLHKHQCLWRWSRGCQLGMCQQHKPQLALEQVLVLGIVLQVTGHRGATDPPAISLHIVAAAAQFGNWPLVPASTSAAGASMHGAGAGAVGTDVGGTGVVTCRTSLDTSSQPSMNGWDWYKKQT